jgi:hypothetical protein
MSQPNSPATAPRPTPATTNRPPSPSATPPSSVEAKAKADAMAAQQSKGADEAAAKLAADAKAKADAEELAFLGAPVILSPELVKETAPQNARNDRQVKMDETVKRLHEAWTNANGPSTWGAAVNARVVATYFVEPEKAEDIKKLVTKAGRFHGVTIRWGTSFLATADLVKKHNLPESYTGREVLSFFVKTTRTVAKNGQGGNRTTGKNESVTVNTNAAGQVTGETVKPKAGDITPKA